MCSLLQFSHPPPPDNAMAKKHEFPNPTALFAEAAALAAQPWDRLETIFDERVARAMARLGLPTAAQFATLQRRVEELTARLDALESPAKPAAPKKAARKAPVRKKA
jgi:hypothetical protein